MTEYAPIPSNSLGVYLDTFSCEPSCCGAMYFIIKSKNNQYPETLWVGDTLYYENATKEEIQELREELMEAANYYCITLIDIDSDCIWDWGDND
jgi:hypothetical protein